LLNGAAETRSFADRACSSHKISKAIEGVEDGLGTPEKQLSEYWLALTIKRDDFTIQHASASVQVSTQSIA